MTFYSETQPPRNLAMWLLHDPEPATERAEQALAEQLQQAPATVLAQLGTAAKASLSRQIVDGLKEMLPGDLVDVFRVAWGDYRALLDAGQQTVHHPDARRVVRLKDQKISFDRKPTFDLVVNGVTLLTVASSLEVVFTLFKPEAIVRAGQLIEVQAGPTSVTGSVQVEEVQIAQREYIWPTQFAIGFEPGVDLTASASPWPTFQY